MAGGLKFIELSDADAADSVESVLSGREVAATHGGAGVGYPQAWPNDQVLVVIASRRRESVRKGGAGMREGAGMRGGA